MPGSAPSQTSDPLGLVGTLIDDRYRVVRLIGRGGMGYVYEATHERIQRQVAVKVLSLVQARRRFEREAVATAKIDHPNSVHLSDFGQLEDGTLYLVMELLEGTSLGRAIDDGERIAPSRALRIGRDILSALKHAHGKGIVHRDIKPENVILTRDTEGEEIAKVLDFGIAKLISDATASEEGEALTEAGMAIGTPTYMSPEQGFGSGIDGRSDLYAMTVLLFEMLTGKPPFRAKEALDTLRLHISAPLPTLAERAPEISHPLLEALIVDGLAKKVDDRIESASAYIERIDEALAALAAVPMLEPEPERAPTSTPEPLDSVSLTPSLELAAAQSSTASIEAVVAAPALAVRPRRRRAPLIRRLWPLWALLVVVIVIAVVVGDSKNSPKGPKAAKNWMKTSPSEPPQTPLAVDAGKLLASGKAREAIALLEESDSLEGDPAAQLVLGHAHETRRKPTQALAAYRRALALLAVSGGDKTMLANVRELLDSRSSRVRAPALEVLIDAATPAGNRDARRTLADVASRHSRRDVREPALEAAERLDVGDLDWVSIHILELHQGRTCSDRLKAVEKLRDLGDKRAIEPLRKAERRMSGGLMGFGSKNINNCLRDAARETADRLESL